MLNLVHISDLHFGKPDIARVGKALHDTILRMSLDVLVIGGIVHDMYFSQQDRFAPTSQHEFARPNRGYLQRGVMPTLVE
jgi:predicted MPP superfamily phosphohydrolase